MGDWNYEEYKIWNSSANEKPDGQSFFSPTNAVTIIGTQDIVFGEIDR